MNPAWRSASVAVRVPLELLVPILWDRLQRLDLKKEVAQAVEDRPAPVNLDPAQSVGPVADEGVGAVVDRRMGQAGQEIGRRLAPVAGFVGMNRCNQEIGVALALPDRRQVLPNVGRIDVVAVRHPVLDRRGNPVRGPEQIEFGSVRVGRRPSRDVRLRGRESAERPEHLRRHQNPFAEPERIHTGAPRRLIERIHRPGRRREGRGHRHHRYPALRRGEVASGSRRSESRRCRRGRSRHRLAAGRFPACPHSPNRWGDCWPAPPD